MRQSHAWLLIEEHQGHSTSFSSNGDKVCPLSRTTLQARDLAILGWMRDWRDNPRLDVCNPDHLQSNHAHFASCYI